MNIKYRKLSLIVRFFDGSKGYFAIAMAASLATTVLNALTPQIFRFSIDSVLGGSDFAYLSEHLWLLSLLLIAVAALSGVSQYICRANTAMAGENFAKNIRDALFVHVQKLPMQWHDQNQTGDIIQRCTSDVEVIRNFVVTQLLEVFRTVFLVVTSFVMMLSMNVKLSMVVLSFVPVVVVYSAVFYRLIAKRFIDADEAEGELSTVVQENATGVRVVRAFGREKFEMDRFREKNEIFARLWIRLGTLSGVYWGVGDLITGFQVVAVIVLGAMEAVYGNISVGEFVAFASYNTTLVWPIRGLGRILSDMSKAGVSFERVDYIIRAEEEAYADVNRSNVRKEESHVKEHMYDTRKEEFYEKEQNCAASFENASFDITFNHVNFAYSVENSESGLHSAQDVLAENESGKKVLSDIHFKIPQGCTFGILGGTGSGKSTIVQLLTRLYELEEGQGSIQIGGKDIRNIPLEQLRKYVGMVLQEPFLYSRTIRENIAACAPDASIDEIRHAAKIACIDEAIMNFPDGYDTLVGERGVTLSGGQRQRVAIARMLLQKAPILVFDDSLSAVDSQTDSLIRKALGDYIPRENVRSTSDAGCPLGMKGATVILISHRITTLMGADQILVLNHGRIEEMGSHHELIRRQGIYRRIYDIQMSQDDRKRMNTGLGTSIAAISERGSEIRETTDSESRNEIREATDLEAENEIRETADSETKQETGGVSDGGL